MKLLLAKLNGEPEIFYTIQGEGVNIGRPAIFVRTSGCNLHCVWCDTAYTWNFLGTKFNNEHKDSVKFAIQDQRAELQLDEVASAVRKLKGNHLVITGGEPMLQQRALKELLWVHLKGEYTCEIETNATLPIDPEFETLVGWFNCSPKLSSSGNQDALRLTKSFPEYVKNEKSTFKFVVTTQDDLKEVKYLVTKYNINRNKVFLMPEGRTPQELHEKSLWLVEEVKALGYRFTQRLHIELWGARRGV